MSDIARCREMLSAGTTLSALEQSIGSAKNAWHQKNDIPQYIQSMNGFSYRNGFHVREFRIEAIPYWSVFVMTETNNDLIVWYNIE